MHSVRVCQNFSNIKHISENYLKNNNSFSNSLILSRSRSLIKYKRNNRPKESQSDHKETATENNGLLSRYLYSLKCNVTVWGSSVVELGVKLDNLSYLRNKNRFLRRFGKLEFLFNGSICTPNPFQLASLRPQLTGSDLLINSPKGSGKTFMYLLPHLVTNYLYNSFLDNNNLNIHSNGHNQRLIVLLPTIDLVVDESRTAYGCFRKFKKVASLLYKDIVLNNLSQVMESDIIYSTPKTFLKFLIKFPTLHNTIRYVVVDESERIVIGEFAYLLVRIRDLLSVDVQYIFLSNFTHNHLLHQFTSRFLKLNFKIISYINYPNQQLKYFKNNTKYNDINEKKDTVVFSNRVNRHIYGPIRDIKDHVKIYNYINSNNIDNKDNKKENTNNNKQEEEKEEKKKGNTEKVKEENKEENKYNKEDKNKEENWPVVYDLEMKIKRNLELIMNNDRNNNNIGYNNDTSSSQEEVDKDNNMSNEYNNYYKIEYVLYEPSKFVEALLSELDVNKKTLVYFPTVKMCQFCYLYFKHYLKVFSKDNNNTNNKDTTSNNKNNKNICEDLFIFYDFHTGLSLDKRRFVMDNFKLANRGILFCTNLAIGVNFNNINKIIQVSFTFNIYELLNKFQFSDYNNTFNKYSSSSLEEVNKDNEENNIKDYDNIERIILLNNLDGHILYEYYKNNINVVLKRTFTEPDNIYRNIDNTYNKDTSSSQEEANKDNTEYKNNTNNNKENKPKMQLEWDIYLLSSCELMYRSLLGYYCENSMKLKLEKWMIPSFFNEFTSSFGISHNFKVSKQFASRTQLLNSPGLEISSSCNRKTDLMASLKSYPGYISKSQKSRISI